MIRRSLFHQLALYFYLPLIGAILETGIALLFLREIEGKSKRTILSFLGE